MNALPTLPHLLDAAGRELAAMGAVVEGLQATLTPSQASAGLQALESSGNKDRYSSVKA